MTPFAVSALESTHVVVFGGSSGIGLATAEAAQAMGAEVTLLGRNPARLQMASEALGGVRTIVADITDRAQAEAALSSLSAIDHLVITAGRFIGGRLAGSDPDELFGAMRERIAGPLYAIRAALPALRSTSSIVLTGGELSDRPSGNGLAVIAAAVRGVEAFGRALALELRPIRINVIAPGFIETPLFDALGEARASLLESVARRLPGGRIGKAEEVAQAILLLLCNSYMNGEVLHIDGAGRFA